MNSIHVHVYTEAVDRQDSSVKQNVHILETDNRKGKYVSCAFIS